MHRVGLPKVALITMNKPKKLSFPFKIVSIFSEHMETKAALVAYKNLEELKTYIREVDSSDYFLLDEERFITYINESDVNLMKKIQNSVKNRRVKSSSEESAKKSSFHIFDNMFKTYWTIF